jgi:hypothetical protein
MFVSFHFNLLHSCSICNRLNSYLCYFWYCEWLLHESAR